jgi:hypothetical protein
MRLGWFEHLMYRSATRANALSEWVVVACLVLSSSATLWILGQKETPVVSRGTAYSLFALGVVVGNWLTLPLWRGLVAKLRQEIEAGGR